MKIPSKVDMILWGLLAAAAIGLGLVVNSWRLDSLKLAGVKRDLEKANGRIAVLQAADEIDSKFAGELATFRQQQQINFKAFDETLRSSKVVREVRYETKDGQQVACVHRDRAEYRRLHNQAVHGTADP